MSGFVVLKNLDGRPVSRNLLQGMTESMSFRGPDEQNLQILDSVGLGHAMLRTTFESRAECQPLTLDGQVWIVSDARVDARSDLAALLSDDENFSNRPDPELILRAYLKWGERCLDHLIGDFSFTIWDNRIKLLFCGRDHFGVKPLYYAHTSRTLIISNTINCIRQHPEISNAINEHAIGDYLLWGSNEYPEFTFYSDINKLPAAHKLTYRESGLGIERYWSLPIQEELRYRKESDYVEHFSDLLDVAVADRLRNDEIAIFLSGGIDSPSVAAAASGDLTKNYSSYRFEAFTAVYDYLIPDEERYYSGLVAEKLGIPINYLACDELMLFDGWDSPELRTPEPSFEPLSNISLAQYRQVSSAYRVVLTGQGGDVILRPSFSHIINLIRDFQIGRALFSYLGQMRRTRRLPRIGLRTWFRKTFGKNPWMYYYPKWINKEFESELDLRSRWSELTSEPPSVHPTRPEAYNILNSVFWTNLFESCDPGNNNFPLEYRHPLFDLRLVRYAMRIPSLPLCIDKTLMRECMKGKLPDPVLKRSKAPLAGDPTTEKRTRGMICSLSRSDMIDYVGEYINCDLSTLIQSVESGADRTGFNYTPVSLNYWLQHVHSGSTCRVPG